jgi:hypothetical protein
MESGVEQFTVLAMRQEGIELIFPVDGYLLEHPFRRLSYLASIYIMIAGNDLDVGDGASGRGCDAIQPFPCLFILLRLSTVDDIAGDDNAVRSRIWHFRNDPSDVLYEALFDIVVDHHTPALLLSKMNIREMNKGERHKTLRT